MDNIHLRVVGLEPMTQRPAPLGHQAPHTHVQFTINNSSYQLHVVHVSVSEQMPDDDVLKLLDKLEIAMTILGPVVPIPRRMVTQQQDL